ncbi:MAG: Glu-tRNA(Gln) amidotransferase subunit GatE [Candidatus Methanomethylophilaceae archaeon]
MADPQVVCGIEIHQQLSTKKLFCSCDSELVESDAKTFFRRLRPTTSEMGEVDRAALMEAAKKMGFRYQAPPGVSCLVEMDDEPPHAADEDAIDTVLTFASMMGSTIVDEIHFMRKLVIDGSNTSGFQRTALVAMGGELQVNGRRISIQSICLEEDAARKVETKEGEVTYRLDRLGIPLIEVATGPDIRSPEEAMEVALRIGTLLRATKRVKRGIGTIREDLNISVPGGARIEVKGVQELRLLPLYLETEIVRQNMLIEIKDILLSRGVKPLELDILEVTDLFRASSSKVVKSALKEKGKVMAVRLPGFAGTLNGNDGRLRLGAEMAQRARVHGVKGIFHSDELPAYGIETAEVESLRTHLALGDEDAFAICAAPASKARAALEAVIVRANEALLGVPEETRDPMPDGTSRYSRPLPGAARMYPETDVPPIRVDGSRLKRIKDNLPELPEEIAQRLVQEHGINAQQAQQIVRQGYDVIFERIAHEFDLASVAATLFLNTFPEMERDGISVQDLDEGLIMESMQLLKQGRFAKEALPSLFREIVKGSGVNEAIETLGLSALDRDQAVGIIRSMIAERADFVKEKGMASIGPLMGPVMQEMRGKLDGKEASDLLKNEIASFLETNGSD